MTTTIPPTAPPVSVRPAAVPVAPAAAGYAAAALALGVAALGAIAVRDAVVAAGWIGGTPWLPAAVRALDGLTPAAWTVAVGALAAVAGLALLAVALAPRRRRGVPVDAHTAVYVDHIDVARVASVAAEEVPGVLAARTSAGRRTVAVRCRATGTLDERIVADAVTAALAGLAAPPKIRVRTRVEDPS